MRKQKNVLFSLSVVTVLAVTAACGPDSSGTSSDSGEPAGDITVTSWRFADPSAVGTLHLELIDGFNESQDAINVTTEAIPYNDVNTELVNSVLSGAPADLVAIGPSELASNAEYLQPVDDFWEAEGAEFQDAFSETARALATHDGQLWGIPIEMSTTDGMWFNKDVLADSGVDPEQAVSSWENFRAALEQIKAAGHTPMLFEAANATRMDRHWSWYVAGGADLTDPDQYVEQMCTPESEETFTFLTDLYLDGLTPNPAGIAYDEATRQFSAGDVGFYADGPWAPTTYEAYDASILDKLGYTHLPPKEEGGGYGANVDGLLWAIPKGSANPEAAWEVMKFMSSVDAEERQAANGNLPTRTEVLQSAVVADDPMLAHFGALIDEHGYPRPRADFIGEFKQIFITAYQAAVTEQQSPADAHASACDQLRGL
ncbi:ABC transporter substrate-binding protein [Jiangella asiatica]|uniref:Extracellular solute-binding protein n=1 Tax=Jiangella asiatica TaxID=2530372 RepID=A0A4R5D721_9ACTN|nr:extracellular solute-binding protein [Jiangella asiatica]TDE09302.1 extracellular solute-binding protein [Jiangella asiatica]